MVVLDNLPNFGGKEGEDASLWLKSFVVATRGDSENAILRIFPNYFEPASPAQQWYSKLPHKAKVDWNVVDTMFRQRWIYRATEQARPTEEVNADIIRNHRLTDDDIFSLTSIDLAAMRKTIVNWAESHAQIGAATQLDDETLIQATIPYLPVFLRAFLKYRSGPPNAFQSLCTNIKEITGEVLKFEYLRRLEAGVDWQSRMEKKLDDLSEIVKGTTVIAAGEVEDEFTPLSTATKWNKTKVSINKAEMVDIVNEAIGNLRRYEPSSVSSGASRMIEVGILHYFKAIRAPGRFHYNRINGQASTTSTVMQGLFKIIYHQAFNGPDELSEATKTWESFSNSTRVIRGACIYKSNHTHRCFGDGIEYPNTQKDALYYGGFIRKDAGNPQPEFLICTYRTVQYFLLSVYLAESSSTSDKAFTQAAIDSANWVIKWGLDKNTHLVTDFTWDLSNSTESGITRLSTHITGLFIEGLCVLASVTHEPKWRDLAIDICNAVMSHRDWHDDEGIFNFLVGSGTLTLDDRNTLRGLLLRGLSVAYQRNVVNKHLRHKIRSYVNVQFNALRDYAHYQGSYAFIRSGPFGIIESCVHGQIFAVDALMAAVIVNHC